jgi:MFS superfamily sulfate permease-like transporter
MNGSNHPSSKAGSLRSVLQFDLPASIVVFLVALPLCLGIAIASGAPPAAGLITGIIGGLLVGWFSGSPLQVSGPAAGLAVILFELIQRYRGEYQTLHGGQASDAESLTYAMGIVGLIVLVGGAIQFVAGLLRLGQWFRAVSPAVIQGMLAGIGVLIFASQFHVMVDDQPRSSGLGNLLALPEAVYKGIFPLNDTSVHHYAAWIGLATIGVIVAWSFAPKRLKVIPSPLAAVVVATLLTAVFQLPISRVELPDSVLSEFPGPAWTALNRVFEGSILLAGLALAAVASAETLLCATAVDQMHQGPRTRYDRELASQGIGNMLCGLLGGLPMTGVIVRSSANVLAGARSRASTILHGVWMLLFVAMLPFALRWIPIASLAAILVYTGYKLVNVKVIRELWSYGKAEVGIYLATVAVIVAKDLLTGVLVGIGLSIARLLYTFSHLEIWLHEKVEQQRTELHLAGSATFLRLPKLAGFLDRVPRNTQLHVHFDGLTYIDHACLDLLMNWEKQHAAQGGSLVIDWDGLTARFRQFGQRAGDNGSSNTNGHTPRREPRLRAEPPLPRELEQAGPLH